MANRKRPVNRATPARRPAAQRGTASRTTAADVRSTETARGAAETTRGTVESTRSTTGRTAPKAARRRPDLSKDPAPQQYSKPVRQGGFWRNWGVAAACALAAVVLGAFAVVGYFEPGVGDGNLAYVDNKATDEVKAAADHALTTLYAYKAKDMDKDKWKASVASVLTDEMRSTFDKYLDTTYDSVKQTQTDTEVKDDPIGVTMVTDDHAELLVNLNVTAIKDGTPTPFGSGPIKVGMVKRNGAWLVSSLDDNK